MNKGIYTVLSGSVAQERRLEILTNNLANSKTPGYKKERPIFALVVSPSSPSSAPPAPYHLSVQLERTYTDFSPGTLQMTGNPLDFALVGDGFFAVQTPAGIRYTRNGSFTVNRDQVLAAHQGYPVLGREGRPLPIGARKVTVAEGGEVSLEGEEPGTLVEIGQLKIVDFPKPYALEKKGASLVAGQGEIPASGAQVIQGALELSNIGVVSELTSMIEVLRAYESYQKVIQTADEIMGRSINDLGRITTT